MKTIKWGIIGCGDVCEVKSGPAFYNCENSELHAVMRRDAIKAADFARRHHIPKWYDNATDLINDPEVNAIYVATPPNMHAEMTELALRAGKPVYVEKPMGISYQECVEMNLVAEECNQKLFVAYYRRALPYFLKVRELLDNDVIGSVYAVKTEYFRAPSEQDLDPAKHPWRVDKSQAGGGYFYDMAPHAIDILMFLLGNITDAKGVVTNVGKLYSVEDTVVASFLFESGIAGSGFWNFASSKQEERDIIEIFGTKGTIRFSCFDFSPITLTIGQQTESFDLPKPEHIQQPLIQSIVDELLEKGTCVSTGKSGAVTNWVIDKIFNPISLLTNPNS